jgi:hypothetical protein
LRCGFRLGKRHAVAFADEAGALRDEIAVARDRPLADRIADFEEVAGKSGLLQAVADTGAAANMQRREVGIGRTFGDRRARALHPFDMDLELRPARDTEFARDHELRVG